MNRDPRSTKARGGFIGKKANARLGLDIIALALAIVFLFPVFWLLVSSLKTDLEIFSSPPTFYPHALTFEPYIAQFANATFLTSVRNSFLVAFFTVCISMILALPAAYGIARFDIPFKGAVFLVFLVTQMMPTSLLLTPLFLTFTKVKLLNTIIAPALAVSTAGIPFIVVLLRPFFKSLPKSVEEAAIIDGCGRLRAFLFVMLPIAKPGAVTALTFCFIYGWNDLMYSMTFNVKESLRPLTANVYKFLSLYGMKWNYIMAYGMILVLPVVVLFIFMQRYIISGLTGGAVKE